MCICGVSTHCGQLAPMQDSSPSLFSRGFEKKSDQALASGSTFSKCMLACFRALLYFIYNIDSLRQAIDRPIKCNDANNMHSPVEMLLDLKNVRLTGPKHCFSILNSVKVI